MQDPANLGTLIRTADAFGFKICNHARADPYTLGSIKRLRQPLHLNVLAWALEAAESFKGIKIGTSLDDAVYIDDFNAGR